LKKIILIHNSADFYGSSRSLFRLTTRLDRSRFLPIVFLPVDGPLRKKLEESGVEVVISSSLRIITRKIFYSFQIIPWILSILPSTIFLSQLIGRHRASVVHSNVAVVCNSALAARIAGVPHIWHVRESFLEFGPLWKPYSRYMLALSKKILCVSRATASQFPDSPKVEVVPNGVDLAEFPIISVSERLESRKKFSISKNELVVGTVGRIKFVRKGQEFLLRAAAHLIHAGQDLKVLLVGGPAPGSEDHLPRLQALAKDLEISDHVVFAGELSNPREAYAAMDIFVLPSAQPEPFGGVVMEAMSLGLPVIGTNIGGTPDQIAEGETGFLVPSGDPEAIAKALLCLTENPALRESMAQAARPRIQTHFPISKTVRHIEESYLQATA
jgi:glycosyltransferase involved in cell wall biosynthesis